ncbi:E3 SUMO-protein ligase ZBED1-like isoform X1, partial [Scomber scombrus]
MREAARESQSAARATPWRRDRSGPKCGLISQRNDANSATYNVCRTVISCKGGNTNNMLKHLLTAHCIEHQECQKFDSLHRHSTSASWPQQQSSE